MKDKPITAEEARKAIDVPDIEAISVPVKEHVHQVVQRHDWRQVGAHLECTSCDTPHGTHIGTNQIMTGIDDQGNPILEKVTISAPKKKTKK